MNELLRHAREYLADIIVPGGEALQPYDSTDIEQANERIDRLACAIDSILTYLEQAAMK
jgi:hypothetical protein